MSKFKKDLKKNPIPSKNYPLLAELIKNLKIIIPLEEIQKLTLEVKLKLIEQLSQFLTSNPEDHVS